MTLVKNNICLHYFHRFSDFKLGFRLKPGLKLCVHTGLSLSLALFIGYKLI